LSIREEAVSAEENEKETQELELWDRIGTTTGVERAEVLDELSHFAFKKNNYTECLQLIDTSIDLYFKDCMDAHIPALAHLYEGKAHCHANLEQHKEAAEAFDMLAGFHFIEEKQELFLSAKRAAGRAWFEADEYARSLECHLGVTKELDIDATDYTMGIDNLNIGMALKRLDRNQEAVEYLLKARPYFKAAKNPEFVNWCDRHLAEAYTALKNGIEAGFHAKHYYNFSKVSENLEMEAYARYRLGQAYWLMKEYQQAEGQFVRALELLTLEGERDWEIIIAANNELAAALFAQGKNGEAQEILERIATIEETMCNA
jgi:tetratricopeptide (TPR) repeat protein